MTFRMLIKDMLRSRVINATLFLFIALSSLLAASSAGLFATLLGSLHTLFAKADAPHFVQMHAGPVDQQAIDAFAAHPLVAKQMTSGLIAVDSSHLHMGGDTRHTVGGDVMDISLVKQNKPFDYLLDTDNRIVAPADGEIGVPVYFMKRYGLKLGDTVRIDAEGVGRSFRIVAFIRDVQMNPSIVSSKRLVISDGDWDALAGPLGISEYLIAFQLHDPGRVGEFETLYQSSGLPQQGPAVTAGLFKLLNGMTDGAVAAVILLASLLLIAVAALCLRFAMLAAMEEDYREIGVMKAIGLPERSIRRLYLLKYTALALLGCVCGYALALPVRTMLTANIALYMGLGTQSAVAYAVPLIAAAAVCVVVILICMAVLRSFRRITAVEALRTGSMTAAAGSRRSIRLLQLNRSRLLPVTWLLVVKDIVSRLRGYSVLLAVFIICIFLLLVPLHLLHTVKSPSFITYMGAGQSDIRLDLQQQAADPAVAARIASYLAEDADVEAYAVLATARYKVRNPDGVFENIHVETGDFTVFPIIYADGSAPVRSGQIALSAMSASQLGKSTGDTATLVVGGRETDFTVSGIYQDVTNGGKTAKAVMPDHAAAPLWYTLNVMLKPGSNLDAKTAEYAAALAPAKVTGMTVYLEQTLGSTLVQLRLVSIGAALVAGGIAALMTAMFLKMMLAKDASQIAIMNNLGFSHRDIVRQYMLRITLILLVGLAVGMLAAGSIGESLIGVLGSIIGASSIRFVINPAIVYLLCPLALITVVSGAAWASANHQRPHGSAAAQMMK